MTLPVSCEYPQVPLTQYDPLNPPAVPVVQVQPSVAHVVPMIAAAVANEASLKSGANPARMFCYNVLSNYFWNNPNFGDVVKLAADLVALNLSKNYLRMAESGVNDAVGQILSMYTSDLIFQYPDMKSIVSPQLLNAAHQNSGAFNNLKQELLAMNSHHHGQPFGGGGGYPQQGGMQPQMPQGQHIMTQQGPAILYPNGQLVLQAPMQQPMMHAQPQPQPQMHQYHNPHQPMQRGHHPSEFMSVGGGNTFRSNQASSFGTPANMSNEPMPEDRFAKRKRQQFNQPQQAQQPIQEAPAKKSNEPSYLEIDKGSEMDRSKHQIGFFDDTYRTNNRIKNTQYTESVELMKKQDASADTNNFYVYGRVMAEPCLESAIITGRIHKYEVQGNDSTIDVFRCFSTVATPLLCNEEIESYMARIREAGSFAQVAVKMKSISMALAERAAKGEADRQYSDTIITFLCQIDNLITDGINDFLKNKLNLPTISIDSFADDYADLMNVLLKKGGADFIEAVEKFERELLASIFADMSDDVVVGLMSHFEISTSLRAEFIPVNYSFTYVPMTSKELGYIVKRDPLIINRDVAPVLWDIVKSLDLHRKQLDFTTIYDVLITADNVRYKVFKHYAKNDEFLIAKM